MPAPASTRAVWKGAISFGLVHIPIVLYGATAETRPRFNLIDPSTMSPVGNKQVSKTTGEAVQREELVKGIQVDEGQYVVLTKDEIRNALPKTTQTIDIECFVDSAEIPAMFFNKPYHVAPGARGQKPFALLREALERTGKAGIARVVISSKQHLAALMPSDKGLVLNLLRWADEVREAPSSVLEGEAVAPNERELKMAEQLVNDMADAWSPDLFHDEFKEKLNELVQAKARAGDTATLQPLPGEEVRSSADVIDLTELLKRSLQAKPAPAAAKGGSRRAANDEEAAPRKAAATKAPAKARVSVKAPARKRSS
jgi:DNA end-binding protein Ku